MAEYEITGVEEVVRTHQVINVEVDGVPYAFTTGNRTVISEEDARSYTLRDVQQSIDSQLSDQDREIQHINTQLKSNKRLARFGEAILAANAVGSYVMGEIHHNHNTDVDITVGVVAVGAIVLGELFVRTESRQAEEKLAVARGNRGRLSSLLRAAQPRKRRSMI